MSPNQLINTVRIVPDFPKKGIQFYDITTLLKDAKAFAALLEAMRKNLEGRLIDTIVGIEARGFMLGAPLAAQLGVGFVPIRKKGKLPAATIEHSYELEYGTDTIAMHTDAFGARHRVAIIDDLLATGGTALAAATLIEKAGGAVDSLNVAIDLYNLDFLPNRKALEKYPLHSVMRAEG